MVPQVTTVLHNLSRKNDKKNKEILINDQHWVICLVLTRESFTDIDMDLTVGPSSLSKNDDALIFFPSLTTPKMICEDFISFTVDSLT